MARKKLNKFDQYISDVLSGKLITGELVRLSVQRHIDDLESGHERGLWFDDDAADHVIEFCQWCKHSKGEWAGQLFEPSPWQEFILRCVFGWKTESGYRRFKTAFVEVAKKNGKSTLAAVIALYLLVADGEPGAEVFSAATKSDQAKIVWEESKRMIQKSPELSRFVKVFSHSLVVESTNSSFKPLSSDTKTLDGPNIHGLIIDELHAHRDRSLVDTLEGGVASRRQPLQAEITTSGSDLNSIGYEHHDYTQKILRGIIQNDSWFGFIAALDTGDKERGIPADDWRDKKLWVKANPNLGISVFPESMDAPFQKALEVPAAQNSFKRLRLNMWTEQSDRWLSVESWDANKTAVDEVALLGRPCYAGLDLSSTTDLAAFSAVFPFSNSMTFEEAGRLHGVNPGPTDNPNDIITISGYDLILRFWVPRDNMSERVRRDRVPYDVWEEQGYLKATAGNGQDYDIIRRDVIEFSNLYQIEELAIDRWNAHQISNQLMDANVNVVTFGQGYFSMSAPSKEFERAILARALNHGGHPVMRWMISNVAKEEDAAENYKPSKRRSGDRIDGVVSTIMAIGRAIVKTPDTRFTEPGTVLTF